MTDYQRDEPIPEVYSKYLHLIRAKSTSQVTVDVLVDVYDVLKAFNVTCPAMQHAIKKMLCPGQRGVKDAEQDKREAIASIERSIELDKG